MSEKEKQTVLNAIAAGSPVTRCGRAKYRVKGRVVHVRFCSTSSPSPWQHRFNINPNTLSAQYELWICGSAQNYYLMPIEFIKTIYRNPLAYRDRYHEDIIVVSVNSVLHTVTFAAGGQSESLEPYFAASL